MIKLTIEKSETRIIQNILKNKDKYYKNKTTEYRIIQSLI